MYKIRKISADFIYSSAGVFIYNAVLQFFLYPELNRHFGSFEYGNILFYISLMTIFSNSFGVAADNVRLTMRNDVEFKNGDFNLTLAIFAVITLMVVMPFTIGKFSCGNAILFAVLAAAVLVRYYSTVVYRMEINYRAYFLFYAFLAAGYAAGTWLLRFSNNWIISLLTGELFALAFVIFCGKTFERPLFKRKNFKIFFQNSFFLAGAELLHNLMINIDRVFLIFIIDPLANTRFYVASLIAKTPILLVQPMSNIILSYLTQKKQKLQLKYFLILSGVIMVLSVAAFAVCRIVSPYFVKIFYPDEFESVKNLLTVVCAGQILLFSGNIWLVLLLTFSTSKQQFCIQAIYFVLFLFLGVSLTVKYGIGGFAWAYLAANLFRCVVAFLAGIFVLSNNSGRRLWNR